MKANEDEFGNYDFDHMGPCPKCGHKWLTYVAQFDDIMCADDSNGCNWAPSPTLFGNPEWHHVDGQWKRVDPVA